LQVYYMVFFASGIGLVLDQNNKPLDLVLVRVYSFKGELLNTAVSNLKGQFSLNLSKGKYQIKFKKPGYREQIIVFTVKTLQNLGELKVKMERIGF